MRQSRSDVALSADSGLFFQPVKFYFQLANLTEQQFRFTVSGDRFGSSLSLKQRFRLFLDRLLPLSYRYRMNTILLANFVDRLHSAQGLKADLGLELRAVKLPRLYLTHRFLILLVGYSLNYCPDFGVHYSGHLLVVVAHEDDQVELRGALFGELPDSDRAGATATAFEPLFDLEDERVVSSRALLDPQGLKDLLMGSYRGERFSAQEGLAGLRPLELTLSYRLLSFRAR